jgi:hypothetical protein
MTGSLAALSRAAHASRVLSAALRWTAACATGWAALLILSLALAGYERGGVADITQTSASAYLDFDLAVLRVLAERTLAGEDGLSGVWARRPDWELPPAAAASFRPVPVRDAWAAVVSDRSRFRTAARGVADALWFLLGGLALALAAAAAAGAAGASKDNRVVRACAFAALLPLWMMLDPSAFYDRTRSLGSGLPAALFVAAFAAALSGAAIRALFSSSPQPPLARPATSARLAAADAVQWLVPSVPALATAALFVCAKADQDPAARGTASGLGALIRAAMEETGAGDRLASCALIAGGLALLSFLGLRFVVEVRAALAVGDSR